MGPIFELVGALLLASFLKFVLSVLSRISHITTGTTSGPPMNTTLHCVQKVEGRAASASNEHVTK